jgi:hypothetical protein
VELFCLALIFRVLPDETQARSRFATNTRNIPELGISAENSVKLGFRLLQADAILACWGHSRRLHRDLAAPGRAGHGQTAHGGDPNAVFLAYRERSPGHESGPGSQDREIFRGPKAKHRRLSKGQAEQLLNEGHPGKFDHVPAAVLSGAVLEKGLRTLCGKQQPPVAILDSKDNPKTLNRLVDDLKKAAAFSELKATQLRSWAAIRNKAAHGEFDASTRSDVELMVPGIQNFLADYLG